MELPFGKYKGRRVSEIPASYAAWIRQSVELYDDLADEFERVWAGKFKRKDQRRQYSPPPPRSESASLSGPNYKALRRKFAVQMHPDRPGGSVDAMRAVNVIFDELESL